eukprot:scaffold15117_cov121-Isochrysis_galbana.AAC.3
MKCDGRWPDGGIAFVYVTRAATPLLAPRSVHTQQLLQSNPSGASGAAAEAVVGCFEMRLCMSAVYGCHGRRDWRTSKHVGCVLKAAQMPIAMGVLHAARDGAQCAMWLRSAGAAAAQRAQPRPAALSASNFSWRARCDRNRQRHQDEADGVVALNSTAGVVYSLYSGSGRPTRNAERKQEVEGAEIFPNPNP